MGAWCIQSTWDVVESRDTDREGFSRLWIIDRQSWTALWALPPAALCVYQVGRSMVILTPGRARPARMKSKDSSFVVRAALSSAVGNAPKGSGSQKYEGLKRWQKARVNLSIFSPHYPPMHPDSFLLEEILSNISVGLSLWASLQWPIWVRREKCAEKSWRSETTMWHTWIWSCKPMQTIQHSSTQFLHCIASCCVCHCETVYVFQKLFEGLLFVLP